MNKKIVGIFIILLMIVTSFNFLGSANENMTNENKLEKIQNAIKENNAQWTAGYNLIFTPNGENDGYLNGCRMETIPIDEYDIIESCVSLPDSFDWRNVNGKNYITSIKTQGSCASCAVFGTIAAIEAIVQIKYDEIFECDLSEAHLFFCGGGSCDTGMASLSQAVDFVKYMGAVDERCFPYKPKEMDCDEKASNWAQRLVTVDTTGSARGSASIKEALINFGPVVTTFALYEDHKSYTGGIYEHVWGNYTGWHHAVTIIGYNDDPGYWICKNCVGEDWGEDGYFRIKYGECEIDETAYYFDDIGGNIQPCKPTNIYPTNGADDIDLDITISWESEDVNGDIVTYSVYFNEGSSANINNEPIVEKLNNNYFQVTGLKKATTYSFRILAEDEHGSQHISDDITFTTRNLYPPVINGPTEGNIKKEYIFTASTNEIDGENYYWFFDWGDGENSGWQGPYKFNEKVTASHAWQKKGNYNVSVRYNQEGLLSDWGILEISTPKIKIYNPMTQLILRIMERFPFLNKIPNPIT